MRSILWLMLAIPLAVGCDGNDKNKPDTSGEAGSDAAWSPAPGTTWQWQLQGTLDTAIDVEMYDIDLFDTPTAIIASLQSAGRVVVCYFSAGSWEEWRDDADDFEASDYGNDLDGWDGEAWLDVRSDNVRSIMQVRLDVARDKGCDAVEPDNVDGYSNSSGFPLTKADQLDYNRFLADEAHSRGLSIGLKNALDLVDELEPHFDWALNEECLSWNECAMLNPFLTADKAVFHTEYVDRESDGEEMQAEVCGDPTISGFSTLIKTWDLDEWLLTCSD